MNNRVCFISDKWCSGNPSLGLTNHFHNLFATFSETQLDYQIHTLHYDESAYVYNRHINDVILQYCLIHNIKVIFLCLMGDSPLNPSPEIIKKAKEMGIFICIFWDDSNPSDASNQNKFKDIADLNVSRDNSSIINAAPERDNFLKLWTVESRALYYPDEQTIPVSFIGSPRYKDRLANLTALYGLIPNITIRGGQREEGLSPEAYARLIRTSKIGINFSRNPMGEGYYQLKGRVFEIISSKSLLLEEKNPCTPRFFTPNVDYVEFIDVKDLVDKINYYNNNESERLQIAENGYNKYLNNYTSKHFWDKIMEKVKI